MYVSERITNIAELEEIISNAYAASQMLARQFNSMAPDFEKIKVLSEAITEGLRRANDFEFCIERRTST